jgi:hypothetical protein
LLREPPQRQIMAVMDALRELLPELRYAPADVERDTSRAPQTASGALLLGGGLGLLGAMSDSRLGRSERAVAAAGSLSCMGIGILASRRPLPLMVPARTFPRPVAAALYIGAAGSTAFGGGHRSPAYFPAVLLTAIGSAIAASSNASSIAAGTIVASGYLAGCVRSISSSQQTTERELYSAASYACGFMGAGLVGSVAGELTLRARVLSDYAARERAAASSGSGRAGIDQKSKLVRECGRDFLRVLTQVDEAFSDAQAVSQATSSIRTALASLRNADTQLSEDEENERLGSWRRLERAINRYNHESGDARILFEVALDQRRSIDAESTGVLLDCVVVLIQNAANARSGRPQPVNVTVRIRRVRSWLRAHEDQIVMSVEDDASGTPPESDLWRTGLWACDRRARECRGTFGLEPGTRGVRAVVTIPYIPSRTTGTRSRTYTVEYERGRENALAALRAVTAAQAAFLVLHRGRNLASSAVRAAAIVGAGEICERRLPSRARELARPCLAVLAMGAFSGEERPPMGGWAATMSASAAANGAVKSAWLSAGLAMAAATARAGHERFRSGLPVTLFDRGFALVGAGSGLVVWKGLKALEDQESQVGGEAWRRKLLLELARPALDEHHFLEPLERAIERSSPDGWSRFTKTPLGIELAGSRQRVLDAQHALADLLRSADPIEALQAQLARLLQPAPVTVVGERPQYVLPDEGGEIDAVGYRLGLVGLGQALAETVRAHLPPTILGRNRLRELRVELRPGDRQTRLDIVQVPFEALNRDRTNAALDAASREAGGRAQVSSSERHIVYVHNSALG